MHDFNLYLHGLKEKTINILNVWRETSLASLKKKVEEKLTIIIIIIPQIKLSQYAVWKLKLGNGIRSK